MNSSMLDLKISIKKFVCLGLMNKAMTLIHEM